LIPKLGAQSQVLVVIIKITLKGLHRGMSKRVSGLQPEDFDTVRTWGGAPSFDVTGFQPVVSMSEISQTNVKGFQPARNSNLSPNF
jgi:hypothetical protein